MIFGMTKDGFFSFSSRGYQGKGVWFSPYDNLQIESNISIGIFAATDTFVFMETPSDLGFN